MSTQELGYVVCLMAGGRQYFLLWQDGGTAPDKYVLLPKTSQFLLARTTEALFESATKLGVQVADQSPALVDMDRVFRALATLRSGRAPSLQTCQLLLDGWNTLEDMARSIQILPDEQQSEDEREILGKVYDKLFYGNNLPAVTPANRNYSPLFSSIERKVMRRYLRHLWQGILERGISDKGSE